MTVSADGTLNRESFDFCRALRNLKCCRNFGCRRFKLPSRKSNSYLPVGAEVYEQPGDGLFRRHPRRGGPNLLRSKAAAL